MTYTVSGGTLSPTHSRTVSCPVLLYVCLEHRQEHPPRFNHPSIWKYVKMPTYRSAAATDEVTSGSTILLKCRLLDYYLTNLN